MGRGLLWTIIFISCLSIISATVISPALPLIAETFGGSKQTILKVKFLIALPGLFTAMGALLAGWFVDAIGRKKLLYIGILMYALGGALPGLLSNSLNLILIGRIIVGLSTAILFTIGTTLIADNYQGHERNHVMGLQTAFIGFTAIGSLTLGGLLADYSWRYPFAVLLISVIGVPLSSFFITENASSKAKHHHASLKIAWIWKYKALPLIYGTMCITLMMFYLVPIEVPFILTHLGTSTQAGIGLVLAIFNLAAGTSAVLYSKVRKQFNMPQVFAASYGLMGSGFLIMSFARNFLDQETLLSPISGICLGLVILGLGFGLTVPNAGIWIQNEAPNALRGRFMSGLTCFLFLGQFLSPFLVQLLKFIDTTTSLVIPIFGSGALVCFLLSLFFLAFKYSQRLSTLHSAKS